MSTPTLLLSLLLSCEQPPDGPSDAQRYAEVVQAAAARTITAEEGLAQCAAIADPSVRGDCALAAAQAAPLGEAMPCSAVPAGLWQEECWFVSAERTNRQGSSHTAARLCQKAGRFAAHRRDGRSCNA